jgi:O-antigen ligase
LKNKLERFNKFLAFVWLLVIGSNAAAFFSSQIGGLQGPIILGGAAYFGFINRRRLLRFLTTPDYLLAFSLLAVPVVLMLIYRFTGLRVVGSIERSGTFFAGVALTFVAASLIAVRFEFQRTVVAASLAIVTLAAALNLYELFAGNVWSYTPGRAAGFYGNPNVSAEALLGYGLVVVLGRTGKLTALDFSVLALIALGVFATFSRSGILLAVVFLAGAVAFRTEPRHLVRVVFFAAAGAFLVVSFVWFVLQNVNLSSDAAIRIVSLIERGGLGDYREDRGEVALDAIARGMESPILGVGLGTIFDMPVGPHNMFVAMFVDFGVVGLTVYTLVLLRMFIVAMKGERSVTAMLWFLAIWHVGFSFVSHNLLSDAETIPLLGIALARSYQILALRRSGAATR